MPYKHEPGTRDALMQELIDRFGASELARRVDGSLTRQAVHTWPRVPERWVDKVAEISGKSCHQIRPDLYARNGRKIFDRRLRSPLATA